MFPTKRTTITPWGQCAVLEDGLYNEVGTSYIWNYALAGEVPEMDSSLDTNQDFGSGYDAANLFWVTDFCRSHLGGGRNFMDGSSRRAILFADGHVEMANRDRSVSVLGKSGWGSWAAW